MIYPQPGYGYSDETAGGYFSRAVAERPFGRWQTRVAIVAAEQWDGIRAVIEQVTLERDALRLENERLLEVLHRPESAQAATIIRLRALLAYTPQTPGAALAARLHPDVAWEDLHPDVRAFCASTERSLFQELTDAGAPF